MNGIRKIVSGWLAICLLLAMLPMNAFAMEATAEESVLYEALPNTYEQPATGTVKVTEDVRFVEQEEDGSFSSRNGTVTKEYALPGLPNVPKMAERNDQNSTSPVDNAYGNLTFSTFEELKTLAAGTYTEYTCAEYVGAGALEISESMRFPENLHINVFSYEIIVPAGIELATTGWIRTARLVVDGVAHINSLSVGDALTVNGMLFVGNGIYIQDHTVVSGEENVYCELTPVFYIEKTVSTYAELEAIAAKAKENPDRGYSIGIYNNLIITGNIALPWNCDFYVGSGVAVTVSAGCTLELDAYTDIAGIVNVLGSLVNNSQINVNYNLGGRLNFAFGSSYAGNGRLLVFSEYMTDPSLALPGLVMANFEVTKYENTYYHQRYFELRYIAGKTKLATPTNLEWGYDHERWIWDEETQTGDYETVAMPGSISWKPAQPTQAMADIDIYRVGETGVYRHHSWSFGTESVPEWRSIDSFCMEDPDSGTYYFTVTSCGDGIDYYNSDAAMSGTWTYLKPAAQVGACTNLSWNWPYVHYSAPANLTNVDGYEVQFYYAPTENEEPWLCRSSWSRHGDGIFNCKVSDWMLQDYGTGYYYFKVRALSNDITVACNGEWSDFSPAFNLTDLAAGVGQQLENVIINSGSMTQEQIRDAVQNMDSEELKSAMLADSNVVNNVAALEAQVGGAAQVEVANAASAFDESKVSIIGANLNNAESEDRPIKLVLDKPEKDHVIDTRYDSAVAVKFSMDLENVEDPQNLAVPVKITLPIPGTINPEFLVILHYHADGTREELTPGTSIYVFEENGQKYASFVLTSFSDFVLTQMADIPEPGAPDVTRLYGDIRYRTAIKIADELKATWGVEKFNTIVVASGDDFPDALAGTYLASAVEAPIVLNSKAGYSFVAEYIQQNLAKNGKIYLLGGTAALQESVEARMKKITPNVVRLAGADRYATCLEILKEAAKYETVSEVMICSGVSYADTLIASATAHPVLLVYGGASMLNQNQKAYLAGKSHTIVGDEATVGTKIATALSKASTSNGRIAGDTCVTTSIAVAETYFPAPTTAVLASGKDYPDGLCGGVLAIAKQSPLLLVADQDDIIADYIATNNIQTGIIVGGSAAVSRDAVTTIFGVVEPEEGN